MEMKSWSVPNAVHVRVRLKRWQTTCGTVARALRDEAHQCTQDAKDWQEKRK
ncbi:MULTISPECIES: hypothetical protein [unclassified Streptomyces]|uniref:hypothetical protein n=1 Tax=unclassified Streptomyces TaxID=2593676 RepID=UPI0033C60CE6